jgi:hypothetical protein
MPALRAILINGLEMADKIAIGIIGTPVKFFAPALRFSGYNIPRTFRAFRERYGPGVLALGKTGTRQKEAEAAEFFYQWLAAFFAFVFGDLIKRTLERLKCFADFVNPVLEWVPEIPNHIRPGSVTFLNLVKHCFH